MNVCVGMRKNESSERVIFPLGAWSRFKNESDVWLFMVDSLQPFVQQDDQSLRHRE